MHLAAPVVLDMNPFGHEPQRLTPFCVLNSPGVHGKQMAWIATLVDDAPLDAAKHWSASEADSARPQHQVERLYY